MLIDQESIQEGLLGLNFAMNPMLTQFTGFNVALSSFEINEDMGEPDMESLEGVAVFTLEDSNSLMQFAPMLGISIDIPEDGTPVELPEGLLPAEGPENVLVARTKTQIALAAGDDAAAMIEAVFADDKEDKDILIRYELSMAEIMNMVSENMGAAFAGLDTDGKDNELVQQILDIYGVMEKFATGIGLSEKGLKVTSEQTFNL